MLKLPYTPVFSLVAMLVSTQAFAQPPPTFQVLGRGVENRQTGEMLALACVDAATNFETSAAMTPCRNLQHVYFKDNLSDPVFIGPNYQLADASGVMDENVKETVKKISKKYRNYLWNDQNHRGKTTSRLFFGAVGVFVGAPTLMVPLGLGTFTATGVALVPGVAPVILVGTGLLVIGTVIYSCVNHPLLSAHTQLVELLKDNDGWNWSISPQKISKSKFYSYLEWVKSKKSSL